MLLLIIGVHRRSSAAKNLKDLFSILLSLTNLSDSDKFSQP
jgi:hypothetical protein